MVRQDRIPHGDMSGDPLVEAPVSEDPEGRRQVLLPVQALLLEGVEFRVRPDLEDPPVLGLALRLDLGRVLVLLLLCAVAIAGFCRDGDLYWRRRLRSRRRHGQLEPKLIYNRYRR